MGEQAGSANVLQTIKADWRRKFSGAMLKKETVFRTPTVRHYWKRQFDQLGRNVYFVSIFGRVLVKGDGVAPLEQMLYERITSVGEECANKVAAMRAIAAAENITEFADFPNAEKAPLVSHIIVPAQNRFLRVLQVADEFLVMVNTLWLEGEISDREKSKAELEIKKQLGQVVSVARKIRISMQAKVNDSRRTAEATTAAGEDATTHDAFAEAQAKVDAAEATAGAEAAPAEELAAA